MLATLFWKVTCRQYSRTGPVILVVGASIGAMPFAVAMDLGYDLLMTIRLSAIYPFL